MARQDSINDTKIVSVESDMSRPGVQIIKGPEPRFSRETEPLLRTRLRAATVLLLLATVILFAMSLSSKVPLQLALLVVQGGFLAGMLVLLLYPFRLSLTKLRALSVAVFGGVTLLTALGQPLLQIHTYISSSQTASAGDFGRALFSMMNAFFAALVILLIYGVFIPTNLRRSAIVVGGIAFAPILMLTIVMLRYPALPEFVGMSSRASVDFKIPITFLLIAAFCVVFGTHIISRLRKEAFKAKQLGQYRLVRLLGAGGMGKVYLAEHRLLKRPCAIKLIHADYTEHDPHAIERFEREVRATAALSHWNTIDIYDYGKTDEGVFYYAMELLTGENLEDIVTRYGQIPPERAIHFLRQVCNALSEAHYKGLLHRDIKPANIFAARLGRIYDVGKLLDFGLVKKMEKVEKEKARHPKPSRLTQAGIFIGSVHYVAPEQAMDDVDLDQGCDIYALGCVAYFILTGQPPFDGSSATAIIVAHIRDEVVPPSEIWPGLPADLERVVLRCLEKKPEDRYPSAESLEKALAACNDAGKWNQECAVEWWADKQPDEPSASSPLLGSPDDEG